MDILVQYAVAAAAVIGLINGVRLLKAGDRWGFIFFAMAILAGILFGYMNWFGVPSIEIGLLVGLASSGFYRVAEKSGGQ